MGLAVVFLGFFSRSQIGSAAQSVLKAEWFKKGLDFIPVDRMGNLLKISVSSSNGIFLLFKNVSLRKYLQHHEITIFDLDVHQQLPVSYGRRVRKNCKLEQKKKKKKEMEQTQGSPGFPRIWGFFWCWFCLLGIMILVFIVVSWDFASSPQKLGHNPVFGGSSFF